MIELISENNDDHLEKHYNCYYCKKEMLKKDIIEKTLKKGAVDKLIICSSCNDIIETKRMD